MAYGAGFEIPIYCPPMAPEYLWFISPMGAILKSEPKNAPGRIRNKKNALLSKAVLGCTPPAANRVPV